jgi:hypothetical protein
VSQGYTPSLGEDPERFLGSCRGKVRHSSKRLALAVMRKLIDSGKAIFPGTLNAYKCRCGHWHVGNDFRRIGRLDG